MRPHVVVTAIPGQSKIVQMDVYGWPNISLQVEILAGTPTYTIDQTLSPLNGTGAIAWFPHPDANLVGASTNRQGNYAFLPNAIRITQVGAGTIRLTTIQVGPSPG